VIYLLYALHIIVCLFLILVVLLQQGKGADLSVFGGGSTQTAFGARGAATLLHKLTVASFIAFIITTVGIAAIQGRGLATGESVLADQPAEEAPATPAPAADTTPAASEPQGEGQPPAEAQGTEAPDGATPDSATPDSATPSSGDQGGDGGQQAP